MGKLHSIYIENFNHLFFKYRKLDTSQNLNSTNSRSKDVATEFQMEGRDRETLNLSFHIVYFLLTITSI